jgi:hypothetical protein
VVDEIHNTSARSDVRRELPCCIRQWLNAVERRQRKQGERRDQDVVQSRRSDRHGEHAGNRQTCGQDRERIGEPGRERIAGREPRELAIRSADPGERVILASVGDELGRATEDLDELGRELRSSAHRASRSRRRAPPAHRCGSSRGTRSPRSA